MLRRHFRVDSELSKMLTGDENRKKILSKCCGLRTGGNVLVVHCLGKKWSLEIASTS